MSALPPPVLEQAHVRLAADYAALRDRFDSHVQATEDMADRWLDAEFQFRATIETQQVTMEALTAILGAMRDNERTLRGQIATLTAENNDLAAKLLQAGQKLAARRDPVAEMLDAQRVAAKAQGGFIWTNGGGDTATHRWDLRSRG